MRELSCTTVLYILWQKGLYIMKNVNDMTIEEKIQQTAIFPITSTMLREENTKKTIPPKAGGYFIGKEIIKNDIQDIGTVKEEIENIKNKQEIMPIICGDFENGCGDSVTSLVSLPRHMALGATNSEELAYLYGKVTARQAEFIGANVALAPVVDLNINPRNNLVSTRAIGDNADDAIKMLSSEIAGMQDNGLSACLKHFPGDGVDWRNQHMVTTTNSLTREEWEKSYGKIYRELIKNGVKMIMIAHIACPCMQNDLFDGLYLPASLSSELISYLKSDIGFDGVCISDSLTMGGFLGWYKNSAIAQVECFKAGIDMVLFPDETYLPAMKTAVENGWLSEKRLDDAVHRILKFKEKISPANNTVSSDEVIALGERVSKEIAERSITLIAKKRFVPICEKDRILIVYLREREGEEDCKNSLTPFVTKIKEMCRNVEEASEYFCNRKKSAEYDRIIYLVKSTDICLPDAWAALCENVDKSIVISFKSPYYKEYFERAQYVINAYSDTESSQYAVVRGLFGEIKMDAKAPVNIQ